MRVAKWQGLGNHFLVVERPPWPLTPERVRLLCDAALGLGADGVLEVSLEDDEVAVVVHNRDGSIAEVSGNGTRIAAAYAAERLGRSDLRVRTGAGVGEARPSCTAMRPSALIRASPTPAPVRTRRSLRPRRSAA